MEPHTICSQSSVPRASISIQPCDSASFLPHYIGASSQKPTQIQDEGLKTPHLHRIQRYYRADGHVKRTLIMDTLPHLDCIHQLPSPPWDCLHQLPKPICLPLSLFAPQGWVETMLSTHAPQTHKHTCTQIQPQGTKGYFPLCV